MTDLGMKTARTGLALGALMIAVSFVTFWLGFEPAWFAVTGLVWGSIIAAVSIALAARQSKDDDSG